LRNATKEDVQDILLDIKKGYKNRIKLFKQELKKVDEIIEVKEHENEKILNYMINVFESQKFDLLDENDLRSLNNFFEIAENLEPKMKR
jgi:hypothetical protein